MRRIYKTARAAVYCGDCREAPRLWPKGIADLIVTDPPYGIGYQSGNRSKSHKRIEGDSVSPIPLIVDVLPVLKRGRHIYIFGPAEWDLTETPLTEPGEIVWDKAHLALGDLSKPWSKSHERITFSTYETNLKNRTDRGYGRLAARLRRGSVIRVLRPNSQGTHLHPTRKPVDVLRPIIESSSLYGEIVFDPFAGSGSTGEAALLEGRRALLIEIDADYCQLMAERLGRLEAWLDKEPK